jgi:hypothetical protein
MAIVNSAFLNASPNYTPFVHSGTPKIAGEPANLLNNVFSGYQPSFFSTALEISNTGDGELNFIKMPQINDAGLKSIGLSASSPRARGGIKTWFYNEYFYRYNAQAGNYTQIGLGSVVAAATMASSGREMTDAFGNELRDGRVAIGPLNAVGAVGTVFVLR